ncbi:hypothetical protein Q0M94_12110 [Deinococcus radiomollis]|uniref:hypothetical protein n=1 Tax=Deinococcus radiomollis TaxID=468916 RepID=UPI0038922F57
MKTSPLGDLIWAVSHDSPETVVQLSIPGVSKNTTTPVRLTLPDPELIELDKTKTAWVQLSRSELRRLIKAGQELLASLPEVTQ